MTAAASSAATTTPTATPTPRISNKHLLDFVGWSVDDIMGLFTTTDVMAQVLTRTIKKVPALQGFTVGTLFFEDSTRTRLSFERAARAQSADVVSFAAGGSSLSKGEGLRDTLRTVEQLQVDLYVIRHPAAGVPYQLTHWTDAPIVNAGDGRRAHPTQALLDAYTFKAVLDASDTESVTAVARDRSAAGSQEASATKPFSGKRLTIVGDIDHSRVARSNVELFTKLGATVTLCGPATLLPREFADLPGVRLESRLEAAVEGAHAVMALRLQRERMAASLLPSLSEYVARYQLTERAMQLAAANAVVMHPGPLTRDVEVASEVADGPRSVIEQQVANGVPLRMAVLYSLLVGKR